MVPAVQVAGRFVGQDEVGIVDQAAGDGHALLLAAGELRRAVARADRPGRPWRPSPRQRWRREARVAPGSTAAPRCSPARSTAGSGCRTGRRNRCAMPRMSESWSSSIRPTSSSPRKRASLSGPIEAAQQVQQRALARSGRSHDGDVIAHGMSSDTPRRACTVSPLRK